jgi:hypothetical protein
MTPQEVQIVEKAHGNQAHLSEWERGFVLGLFDNLPTKRRYPLTDKQVGALHRIDEKLAQAGVGQRAMRMTMLSGVEIDFHAVTPEQINIWDIAHGLSMLCRFNGQVRQHYSVAQHSIRVAELVPMGDRLQALLHDATEAYLGDVITPLKNLIPEYRRLESTFWRAITTRFRIPEDMGAAVKAADQIALEEEASALTSIQGLRQRSHGLVFMDAEEVQQEFIGLFFKYGGKE